MCKQHYVSWMLESAVDSKQELSNWKQLTAIIISLWLTQFVMR